MKVFLEVPYGMSRAMSRVANALTLYAPNDVETVTREEDADLVVLHVTDYPVTVEAVSRIRARGQRYLIIQYCLRSTQERWTFPWLPLWADAMAVWSYYDLPAAVQDDLESPTGASGDYISDSAFYLPRCRFYHAPLGVDSWVFFPMTTDHAHPRGFTILTSGYMAEPESVAEAAVAVRRVSGNHFHLGPRLPVPAEATRFEMNIADDQLAGIYRSCRYVAGLRRVEGFELPAAEGLVCGARPICFDRPHYRQWFEPWAEFIPEGTVEEVTDALETVFRSTRDPLTFEEASEAAHRFDWARIVPEFWQMAGVKTCISV